MPLGLEHIPQEETPAAPNAESSTLDRIRAMYAKAQKEQHLDLPLPRNTLLGVRYRPVDPDDVADTARNGKERNLDILIAACETMLVRGDDGEWEPLTDGGVPVQFDESLSEIAQLGVPPVEQGGTAREVCLRAFSTAPAPHLAVANHVIQLTNWMAGEDGQIDEESLLGES